MDMIELLWTGAEDVKLRLIVLIVLANMLLALRLYGTMSKARFRAAKEGRVTVDTYRATQSEPEDLAVFNRAVVNQFESPVLFYAIIAIGLALKITSWLTVILALAYVALRWRHALEMVGDHEVLKRRQLFIYSFYALIGLMAELFISALLWL
ncbi:MAG: MAPEG family protein [Pseudomonadota bacterium]